MNKELDVKIGTPEEAFWTSVKKKCAEVIAQFKHEIVINTHVLELAEKIIKQEESKK